MFLDISQTYDVNKFVFFTPGKRVIRILACEELKDLVVAVCRLFSCVCFCLNCCFWCLLFFRVLFKNTFSFEADILVAPS